MSENFIPRLTTTDWNDEWIDMQQARERVDDPALWDKRAKTFPTKHGSQSQYVSQFIELMHLQSEDTVFDMGCGTGALALPLAKQGHDIIACDFSSGMLGVLQQEMHELQLQNIEVVQMSWDDDWAAHGVQPKCVDVALASRSIATHDLRAALQKLTAVARRRACMTLPCGPSPKVDKQLLKAAGLQDRAGHDYQYAFNILVGMGLFPEVAYIPSSRFEAFDSPDEALDHYVHVLRSAVKGTISDDEYADIPAHLKTWLDESLVHDDKGWHLKEDRVITWAFMAWDCA